MEQVPGCWEHISMVWAALKEAKSKNLSLATICFDIANAYGSIPHKLDYLCTASVWCLPKMDPLNRNVLLWDIQQVFFSRATQQLA